MHLVLTDSGLGGLAVCAGLERVLRRGARAPRIRLTFVNAWPEEGRGYNDFPNLPARARMFDAALTAMDRFAPDAVVVACNTLSVLYDLTAHRRRAATPVRGIIDAGTNIFAGALREHAGGAIVLIGTRTTIESRVHRDRLASMGVSADRIGAASCHGLATAIEDGPGSDDTAARLSACTDGAAAAAPAGAPLFLGLCCTHYGLVSDQLRDALAHASGRDVRTLDPNEALVGECAALAGSTPGECAAPDVSIEVVSKVRLSEPKRNGVASLLEPVSTATARALREYTHVPDLF
jgi:glutamate racemase